MADISYLSTKIVTAPVSVKGVADLIGAGSYDVGKVCTSERINKWARYKPFNSSRISFVQDENSTVRDKDEALSDVHFGLKINSMSPAFLVNKETNDKSGDYASGTSSFCKLYNYDISEDKESFLYKLAMGTLDDWTYIPRTAPFRLADFNGYKHNCVSPLPTVQSNNIYIPQDTIRALKSQKNDIEVGNITLGDISIDNGVNLGNFYTGVLFYNRDLTNCFVLTSNQIGGNNFGIRQQGLRNEKFFMKTFLCSEKLDDSVNIHGVQAYFVGCDMKEASVCNIYISNNVILKVETLKVVSEGTGTQMNLRVTVHNYSGLPVYVTGARFGNDFSWTSMDSLNSNDETLGSLENRTYSNTSLSSLDIGNETIFECIIGTSLSNGTKISCSGGEGASAEYSITNS